MADLSTIASFLPYTSKATSYIAESFAMSSIARLLLAKQFCKVCAESHIYRYNTTESGFSAFFKAMLACNPVFEQVFIPFQLKKKYFPNSSGMKLVGINGSWEHITSTHQRNKGVKHECFEFIEVGRSEATTTNATNSSSQE